MAKGFRAALLVAVGAVGTVAGGISPAQAGSSRGKPQVIAFYAAGTHMNLSALWKYPRSISAFSPFWYSVNAAGNVVSHVDGSVLARVRALRIPVEPLVNDGTGVQAFLHTRGSLDAAARNIADLVKANHYQGVVIDFEPPNNALRTALDTFAADLRDRLPTADVLALAIVPNSGGAYDFAGLKPEIAPFILMSYDEHAAGTPPGPVAAAPWVTHIVRRLERTVPARQIVMGIPLYGYVWPAGSTAAVTVPYRAVPGVMNAHSHWNAADMETSATWHAPSGTRYIAWWESLQGIAAKLSLAKRDRLGGVALWRLGYQNAAVMQLLLHDIGSHPTATP